VALHDELRASLDDAIDGAAPGLAMAERLCLACVRLLDVDGASISVMHEGSSQGTFGSSGSLSRQLDELQFTFGEGPCMDAVKFAGPVFVDDFGDPQEQRWPAYAGAVLDLGVRAVYALPVGLPDSYVGALDLYRHAPGPLEGDSLIGGLMAAELAALPLLDLMGADRAVAEAGTGWDQLASLSRVEVYQATGMVMGQLDVGPSEALVRLRAHAFAEGVTASEVAWAIVERRLTFHPDSHGYDGLGGQKG
jgi:hypothetical protein